MTGELWRALLSVITFLVVVGGLGFGTILLRRYAGVRFGNSHRRRLQLVDRLELGDRRFVAIVRLDQRELVIGGGLNGISLLESNEAPVEPAEQPAPKRPFLAELAAAVRHGRIPSKRNSEHPTEPKQSGLPALIELES